MVVVVDERELVERVRALDGMDEVLPALEGGPDCFLVGGAVRDLLLGRRPVDVDIAVEGDAEAVAAAVAARVGGNVVAHERFGTATVQPGSGSLGALREVNFAATRRETYPQPGALPDVEPARLADDLGRRDFTVNALALGLVGDGLGRLHDRHGGRDDLEAGLIRVLHPASFADDPTRLLRAVRYAVRLGFALEPETEAWAREAAANGALATVSGPRIRDELIDLLAEDEAPAAVELLRELGLDRALHPALVADPELVASAKLAAGETGADPVLAALAALLAGGGATARVATAGEESASGAARAAGGEVATEDRGLDRWVDRLGLGAGERDAVVRATDRAPALVGELREEELRPSRLHALLAPEPPETLALALALGAPGEPVLDFVARLRGVRLEIDGADLIAAGVPESPALGRALAETLARKLDGEVGGREDELRTAVELARGEG